MAILYTETPWDVSPDSTSQFEIYNADDQIIMANGTDSIKKYDGTDFTSLEGGSPNGSIVVIYKGRLVILDNASTLWFSHIRNAEGWSTNFDYLPVFPEDGGKFNGADVQNDELIISKTNGKLYGWRIFDDGDPQNSRLRQIEDSQGFVNFRSKALLREILYYLDRNVLDTVGGNKQAGGISYPIQEVIEGIQSYDNIAIGANDGKVYISLGNIEINIDEVISLTNAVIVFDTVTGGLSLRDDMSALVFTRFIDSSSVEDLYFGDANGKVFKLNDGTKAGENNIQMRIRTKPFLSDLGKRITINKVCIFMDEPDNTTVHYRTNTQDKFSNILGEVTNSPQWFEVAAEGACLQLEFTHSRSNARPTLKKITIDYTAGGDYGR